MYPHAHLLGARVWTSSERDFDETLGEWGGAQEKTKGKPPVRVPLPILVGTPDCIEHGEHAGLPIIPNVSALCAKVSPAPCYAAADVFLDLTDVLDCVFAKASVDIIADAYEDLPTAVAAVTAFLGFFTGPVTSFEQLGDLLPAGVIARINDTALLWLTGTSNETQLAVQALQLGSGPMNQGFYSTTALYEAAANHVATQLIDAGCGASARVVLIGHSYGGAVCQVLAAKMVLAGPITRRVELMTFGSPQPGDRRLHDINANLRQTHYANERDPIPYLPPTGFNFALLDIILGPILSLIWPTFRRPPNQVMITRQGKLVEVQTALLPDDTMYIAALLIAQGFEIPKFKDHGTDWYSYYLCQACQCVPRPCIAPGDDFLVFELEIEGLEIVANGSPATLGYGPITSNLGGGFQWDWVEGPFVRAELTTTVLYPGVYGDCTLYYAQAIGPDELIECVWYFPAELDIPNKGFTTTALPDNISNTAGVASALSMERLRISPILL